jgi:hypothetical protein
MQRLARHKSWMALNATYLSVAMSLGTLFPVTVRAQGAPAARDFMNTPINAASFFGDFVFNRAETASSTNSSLPNNETLNRVAVVTILWSFPMFNRYANVALGEGYTGVQGTGVFGKIRTTGFTDPSFTFHANLFGAPALSKAAFPQTISGSFSSFHITVNASLGSYDRNSPVNTGANRWAFNPLFNLSLTPDQGESYFDIYAGARFFTNNNAYLERGQLSQKPLANFAAHYSLNIGRKMYASIGVYYDRGGETSVNQLPQDNASNGFRPGVSISRLIWKFRFTLRYERTASTPNAAPTNGLLALRMSGFLF